MTLSRLRPWLVIIGGLVAVGLTVYGLVMPGKELPEISMAAEIIPVHLPIPGFQHGIPNTLPTAIFVAILIILLGLAYFRSVKRAEKTGKESRYLIAVEAIIETVNSFLSSVVGEKLARQFLPIIGTFFFFILFANWIGLIPGMGSIGVEAEHHGHEVLVPIMRSPSADLSTTMGLAIVSLAFTQYYGFRFQGVGYLKKFFNFSAPPDSSGLLKIVLTFANGFAGLLELIAEFIKIFSFAFRLFGNVFAGEVLLLVITYLASFIAVIPFMGLELFVGAIQALIFSMLSLIFFQMAAHHH